MAVVATLILLSSSLLCLEMKQVEDEIISRISLSHVVYQGHDTYGMKIISDVESNGVLTEFCNTFLNENFLYVDYLVKDVMVSYLKERDHTIHEPDKVISNYREYLIKNKEKLYPVIGVFAAYLKAKGQVIEDGTPLTKEKIDLVDFKALAVRNIIPLKFSDSGKLMYKICVAGEGFVDYAERNTQVEAFAFDTIMNAFKDGSLEPITERCSHIVDYLKLSTEADTAIRRAQGVFWALLFVNQDFEKLLLDQYIEKKDYLPFIVESF
jgi:hypothetical protein